METVDKKRTIADIAISIGSVAVVGVIAKLFTDMNSGWYSLLTKPSDFLPQVVFPILWTIVYAAFAVVLFLLLQRRQMDVKAIVLFGINGILMILWSIVFFKIHSVLIGLCLIVLTLAAAILLLVYLCGKDKTYAYILYIYPIWMTVATLANAAIWILN